MSCHHGGVEDMAALWLAILYLPLAWRAGVWRELKQYYHDVFEKED